MPHVLSVEESDAPGDGIDGPDPSIVISREGGGGSSITSVGFDAARDGSDVEPFIDDEHVPEII
jgi:hypothetical protein